MMNSQKSLEQTISKLYYPNVDVHDSVMYTISTLKAKKNNIFKLYVTIALSLILLVGTGFASMHIYELYSSNGEATLTLKPFDLENTEPNSTSVEEYMHLIDEGEAIVVSIPQDIGPNILQSMTKPVTYLDWLAFYDASSTQYKLPNELNREYAFVEGRVAYAHEFPDITWQQDNLFKNGGEHYRYLEVYEEITTLSVSLVKAEHTYTLGQTKGERYHTLYTNSVHEGKGETFILNDIEGIFILGTEQTKAYWRDVTSTEPVLYQITTTNTSANVKEEIIHLLSSFVNE